jgi:hypothetical protein
MVANKIVGPLMNFVTKVNSNHSNNGNVGKGCNNVKQKIVTPVTKVFVKVRRSLRKIYFNFVRFKKNCMCRKILVTNPHYQFSRKSLDLELLRRV